MNRDDILAALSRINDAIASLNVRLHPPPADPNQRQELESELASAEQSREALEAALNNLPDPTAVPTFAAAEASVAASAKSQNDAAIEMSKSVREHADNLTAAIVEPVNGPTATGGIRKKTQSGI
jgi:hypothetical protein